MKKIVAIGNSIAGVKALETIRSSDAQSELTIFALDGFYPYCPELFIDYFLQRIREGKLLYKAREFYEQHRIKMILQRQMARVNFKKKKIFTEEKDQIDFDFLIITDTNQVKFPDIKGIGKTGVFALRKLADLKRMMTALPFVETVVIATNSPQGPRMAAAFKEKGKEVMVVVPSQQIFVGEPTSTSIIQQLEGSGIRVILDNAVVEVLGDSDVKAVRLKSGKVLAAEMVIFTDTLLDFRIFADTELEIDQRILIDSSSKTNIEGVFAFPPAARFREEQFNTGDLTSTFQQEEAGKIIAANICGQNVSFPILQTSAELGNQVVMGNSPVNW